MPTVIFHVNRSSSASFTTASTLSCPTVLACSLGQFNFSPPSPHAFSCPKPQPQQRATTMDELSPEVLSLIIDELFWRPNRLSPRPGIYASISRKWQDHIEAHTFAHISLTLNTEDLSTFETVFKEPRRQPLLRTLDLNFHLPARGHLHAGHVANSAALGTALTSLCKFLSTWETYGRTMDVLFSIDHRNYTPARRFQMLDQPETVLAAVRHVSSLQITDDEPEGKALHPTATCKIASAFPNLQFLNYTFYDPQPKRAKLRKEIRKALGTGMNSLDLPMLERLHLRGGILRLMNHSLFCGDLRDEDGVDPLNSAIHKLLQRSPIKWLELEGLVSSELFTGDNDNTDSTWPTLEQFEIRGSEVAPSGKWYSTGDPTSRYSGHTEGYGSDAGSVELSSDSDISWHRSPRDDSGSEDHSDRDAVRNGKRPEYEWRDQVDWEMLTPLLVAMARAVQRMPKLQQGSLLVGDIGPSVCVQCAASGFCYANVETRHAAPLPYEPKNFRTCRFFVGRSYDGPFLPLEQVPEEVRDAWREWLGDDGEMEAGYYYWAGPTLHHYVQQINPVPATT